MKLTEFESQKIKIEETILLEKLGTLSQLGVGPLINILKQGGGRGRRGDPYTGPMGPKFTGHQIGSTSEVVDVGVIKDGIKSIRKAYKTQGEGEAFALYIGEKPVLFGVYDADTLAGASRTGKLAYDLSAFKETVDAIDAEAAAGKPSWHQPRSTQLTTYREKERPSWEQKEGPKTPHRYQGEVASTRYLAEVIDLIMDIAKRVNQPVTAKLVLGDKTAMSKRSKRYSNAQIGSGAKDLRTRLAIYKNMKKPTVETIEDFVKMSLDNPGKQVRFAGTTYLLKSTSYDKIDPTALLTGKPFQVSYKSSDPGSYDSLDLTYSFDPKNNQLMPIFAVWYDRTDPANRFTKQEGVLDPIKYSKIKLGVADLTDKAAVVKKILEMFKAKQYNAVLTIINSLKKAEIDWPELDTILKSTTLEYEREKQARG